MEKAEILTLEQVSAGGTAFRRVNNKVEIAIVAVAPNVSFQKRKRRNKKSI